MTWNNFAYMARSHIDSLKQAGVPKLMREGNAEALWKIAKGIDYQMYKTNRTPNFEVPELDLVGENDALATAFYIWANPYLENGDLDFFFEPDDFVEFLSKQGGSLGKKISEILDSSGVGHYLSNTHYEGLCLEQLLGLEAVY